MIKRTIKLIDNIVDRKENHQLTFNFMSGYRLKNIMADRTMLNLFETPILDASMSNIYLRELDCDNNITSVTPLLTENDYAGKTDDGNVVWLKQKENFIANVTLSLSQEPDNIYYYSVSIKNMSDMSLHFDLIYGQDLSLSEIFSVKTNESYSCQYLDHAIFDVEKYGYVVASRQNLKQSNKNPFLQLGSLSPVVSFSTDAYQFLGKQYEFSNIPQKLFDKQMDNENYQYEMTYIALQLQPITLQSKTESTQVFYGYYLSDLKVKNVEQPINVSKISQAYHKPKYHSLKNKHDVRTNTPTELLFYAMPLSGQLLSNDELEKIFPGDWSFIEKKGDELLSFFQKGGRNYITLPNKEHYQERATGHIISSGNNLNFKNSIMNSTHFIYGVFNSHLLLGNTVFNKLLGVNRNALNFFKSSGQRIQVKLNGAYRLLTMPSAYEVGVNFSRWIYQLDEGVIQVYAFSSHNEPIIQLDILLSGFSKPVDVIVTHQLIMGENEENSAIQVLSLSQPDMLLIRRNHKSKFPIFGITFSSDFNSIEQYEDKESKSVQYLALKGMISNRASIAIGAKNRQIDTLGKWINFEEEVIAYENQHTALLNNLSINFSKQPKQADKLNHTLHWFMHNALIHYSSPHGLEQYSGAAWGIRDVCQGPVELFMALGRYEHVKKILCEIYCHQYLEEGNWPQWFMFDDYSPIQKQDSKGDIVVWPLKALTDYLLTTNNTDILLTQLPYTSINANFNFTSQTETLLQHVDRQIDHIIAHLIPGTFLSSYGLGDWDDTLKPADQSLCNKMVSGWTIPLTLQVFKQFTKALSTNTEFTNLVKKIHSLSKKMESDYHKYLIKDGVISGFIHFVEETKDLDAEDKERKIEYLLHPSDKKTGIKYRLLPFTRSIISETFDKSMAINHMNLILENLNYPDGVRLMDKMVIYKAGQQNYFSRAELAANVGREVGLQYCHAHIRFIEALCKMGMANELYENLFKISPVDIKGSVANADIRQSNCYFSSSDAKFNDRYQAYDNLNLLKEGKVAVKGGWRIYSSGPGIYINQIVTNVFGLRQLFGNLLLDPVISKRLGYASLTYLLYEKFVTINIYPDVDEFSPKRILLNNQQLDFVIQENPYRLGAALIQQSDILTHLAETNQLDIYL